jgi:hypothetical protein
VAWTEKLPLHLLSLLLSMTYVGAAMKMLLMLQGFLVRPCKGVVLDDKILQVILTNCIRCLDIDYFMANVFISQSGSLLSFCCIT